MALIEQQIQTAYEPIRPEEAREALATGQWGDDPALKLVVQDALRAENFQATKQWVMNWPIASSLYQSPYAPRYWEGTQSERANIPMFTVAAAVNSLTPQVMSGLFYQNPPFMIQERPKTKAQAARAIGAVIGYQLEDINFREQLRLGCNNCLLFGTAIWKWGWETFTRKRKTYRRAQPPMTMRNPLANAGGQDITIHEEDEEIEEIEVEEYVDRPTFENIVNLRQVLVDPGLNVPDIRQAKYVVHRLFLTWEDLDKLRDRPGFNIPSRKDLLELFLPPKEPVEASTNENTIRNPLWDARAEARYEETTEDVFNQPLEVLERWDNNKYMVVLQKKLVICNDDNPYGVIPFLSVGWWDVPEAFWSMGLAKTIGSEQRLQQGITNTWLDNAALNLNGVYVRVRGKNVPTQSIRISPGKIVEVDNKDDFQPLKRLDPVPEAGQHLALSESRVDRLSTNPITGSGRAGDAGHSNLGRSAAGAQLIGSGANNGPAEFVEKLANQVMVPFLFACHEMNCALLPASTLRYILTEELQNDYLEIKGNDVIDLLNSRVKFTILAAAKMQARRNMAQALPIMIQYLTSEQTTQQLAMQGKKIDVAEIMRMMFETSQWANVNDVIVDMTPEDQQRMQAQSPMAVQQAKIAAAGAQQDKQFQQKQQLVDQENIARAAREVMRSAIEHESAPGAALGTGGFE